MKPMRRRGTAVDFAVSLGCIAKSVLPLAIAAFLLSAPASMYASDSMPASRLPRTNLLVFHGRDGEIRTVKSKADWLRRRAEIIQGMQAIMGPLPGGSKRCPLNIQVDGQFDCGSFIRLHLSYTAEPGSRVPAYLLVPKVAGLDQRGLDLAEASSPDRKGAADLFHPGHAQWPAVLALHSTDMTYGNRVLVEQLRPQYRTYGVELVRRGYVVLAPAYPLMADYQPDLKALGYRSGTMKAIWDNIRGLDLLDSLPFVRRGRFGAIGHSLGGHNAVFTAVFEPRIKVVVSSCGFDSFVDYQDGHIEGWTSDRYMPALKAYRERLADIPFDFYELIGALAPRPVFINAPLDDANFKSTSVDQIVQAAAAVYRLYGVPGNLQLNHPAVRHEFPDEQRQQAYHLLDQALR